MKSVISLKAKIFIILDFQPVWKFLYTEKFATTPGMKRSTCQVVEVSESQLDYAVQQI